MYFKVVSNKIVAENDCNTVQMSDYSFICSNFPPNITDEKDLVDHFSQFGEVIEAGLARQYYGCLSNFRKESVINKKILAEGKRMELNPKRGKFRLNLLQSQKQKLSEKTQKKLKGELLGLGHDEYPSLWGYVVFNDISVRNQIYKDYKRFNRWSLKRIFCNCLWTLKKETPENY